MEIAAIVAALVREGHCSIMEGVAIIVAVENVEVNNLFQDKYGMIAANILRDCQDR
jgi:hypothetical protein